MHPQRIRNRCDPGTPEQGAHPIDGQAEALYQKAEQELSQLMRGVRQRAVPSLCSEWSVLEVIAHLVVPLQGRWVSPTRYPRSAGSSP